MRIYEGTQAKPVGNEQPAIGFGSKEPEFVGVRVESRDDQNFSET